MTDGPYKLPEGRRWVRLGEMWRVNTYSRLAEQRRFVAHLSHRLSFGQCRKHDTPAGGSGRVMSFGPNSAIPYLPAIMAAISSSAVPMGVMANLSTRTLATLGERKPGRVGPSLIPLTPR